MLSVAYQQQHQDMHGDSSRRILSHVVRQNPIDFGQPLLNPGLLGLHVFDYNFPLGDLLELVEQAASN
jgi:hypothetical protein